MIGAGERTPRVAEQLTLEEVGRDRTAIDRDERSLAAAVLVQQACDEFLARAGLTLDQHRGRRRCDAFDQRAHVLDGRRVPDQFALRLRRRTTRPGLVVKIRHGGNELLGRKGSQQHVGDAAAQGVDCGIRPVPVGDHDDL